MKTGILVFIMLMVLPTGARMSSPDPTAMPVTTTSGQYHILETLTIYHPVEGQCDNSPLVTANNSRIDLTKLYRNEIRWMALSRNLLKRWNGVFNYGDTVVVSAGDPSIDGLWVINDSMNKRFRDRGDLLFHQDNRSGGIWKGVKISRWEGRAVPI